MDIRFGIARNIEVNDVRDALDVQTSRGNIGRDQNIQPPRLQLLHRTLTLVLCNIAIDSSCTVADGAQLLRDFFSFVLRAGKHDHAVVVDNFQNANESVELRAVLSEKEALGDVFVRTRLRFHRHFSRIVQVLL